MALQYFFPKPKYLRVSTFSRKIDHIGVSPGRPKEERTPIDQVASRAARIAPSSQVEFPTQNQRYSTLPIRPLQNRLCLGEGVWLDTVRLLDSWDTGGT